MKWPLHTSRILHSFFPVSTVFYKIPLTFSTKTTLLREIQNSKSLFPKLRESLQKIFNTHVSFCERFVVVSRVFCGHFTSVLWLFNEHFVVVSLVFHGRFTSILRLFHERFTVVSQALCGHFTSFSWSFHEHFVVVSRVFCGCFMSASWLFH